MKHWKRLLSCVLAGSLALALAACTQQSAGGSSAGNQSTDQSADQSREEVSSAAQSAAGFGTDTNEVTMIRENKETELPIMSKEEVAGAILDEIFGIER